MLKSIHLHWWSLSSLIACASTRVLLSWLLSLIVRYLPSIWFTHPFVSPFHLSYLLLDVFRIWHMLVDSIRYPSFSLT